MSQTPPRRRLRAAMYGCILVLVGCGRPAPPSPVDTGAREAARVYFDAVIRKDWNAQYDALPPESRKRFSREQFAGRALANRKRMRFEPEVSILRSCEEHGAEAIARVVLTTRATRHKPRFNDAVVVRRTDGVWRVVLPDNFGR